MAGGSGVDSAVIAVAGALAWLPFRGGFAGLTSLPVLSGTVATEIGFVPGLFTAVAVVAVCDTAAVAVCDTAIGTDDGGLDTFAVFRFALAQGFGLASSADPPAVPATPSNAFFCSSASLSQGFIGAVGAAAAVVVAATSLFFLSSSSLFRRSISSLRLRSSSSCCCRFRSFSFAAALLAATAAAAAAAGGGGEGVEVAAGMAAGVEEEAEGGVAFLTIVAVATTAAGVVITVAVAVLGEGFVAAAAGIGGVRFSFADVALVGDPPPEMDIFAIPPPTPPPLMPW